RGMTLVMALIATALTGCGSDDGEDKVPQLEVLQLEMTGPTYTAPQAVFIYHLTATNAGSSDLSAAPLEEHLPPQTDMGVLQVNSEAPWVCVIDLDTPAVVCRADTFPPGANVFDITGFFTDVLEPGDTVKNSATLSADGVDSATATSTATVLPGTTLTVTKTTPESAIPGETIRYDLTMTNTGTTRALAPQFQEHFPDEIFPKSFSAPLGWECGFTPIAEIRYVCNGPDLQPGDSVGVAIMGRVSAEAVPGTVMTNRIVGVALNAIRVEATASTEVISAP